MNRTFALALAVSSLFLADAGYLPASDPGATVVRGVAGPLPELPQAVAFDVALREAPDADGRFVVTCRVAALLADVRAMVRVNPGDGVVVVEAPERLAGVLRTDRAREFDVVARRLPGAHLPTALNVELRYQYPFEAARAYTEADPHGRCPRARDRAAVAAEVSRLQAAGPGEFVVDRAAVIQ